jgi:hypothetical protein
MFLQDPEGFRMKSHAGMRKRKSDLPDQPQSHLLVKNLKHLLARAAFQQFAMHF